MGFNPFSVAGAALGIVGGIGQLFGAKKANKRLNALLAQDPSYQANPVASQRMGLASQLLNARAPGAASAERNIFANQANQISNINRAATDSGQALALATGAQGQTNEAIEDLGQQETADYQRRYGNLSNAQDGVIAEDDKVYQDKVRRFQDLAQIRGAQQQNRNAGWQTITNAGMGIMNFGLAGGFGKMFGKNNN